MVVFWVREAGGPKEIGQSDRTPPLETSTLLANCGNAGKLDRLEKKIGETTQSLLCPRITTIPEEKDLLLLMPLTVTRRTNADHFRFMP